MQANLMDEVINHMKDKWEEHWDKVELEYPNEAVVRFFSSAGAEAAGSGQKRVLDFGCGTGQNAIAAAKKGYCVTAVDYAKTCLDKLNCLAEKKQILINVVQNNGLKVPLEDKSFDIILAWGSVFLNTRDKVVALLKELNRVMESGGSILIECRTQEDDAYQNAGCYVKEGLCKVIEENCYLDSNGILRYYPSVQEIKAILSESGFAVSGMEKFEFTTDNMKIKNSWWHIYGEKIKDVQI